MNRLLLVPVLALAFITSFKVQAQHLRCGAAHINNQALAERPELGKAAAQLDAETRQYRLLKNRQLDTVVVIPVVFHVVHNFGRENVSMAQISDAMRIINEDFMRLSADTGQITATFAPLLAKVNVQFALAKRDPFGNCTDGVTRTIDPANATSFTEPTKNRLYWPTERYLNIYVSEGNSLGAGGYAYYPGRARQPQWDGIVVNAGQLGSIGASGGSNFSARTLTHEVGHYLNLMHTWGNSNEPGKPDNCNIDDDVLDTPLTIGVTGQGCNLGFTSCGGVLANVENYMDYSSCGRMFTLGQSDRMNAALRSSVAGRRNLWSDTNLVFTGVLPGAPVLACRPRADFNAQIREVCVGSPVSVQTSVFNVPLPDTTLLFRWQVQDGFVLRDSVQNPQVVFNSPGRKQLTLVVSNANGIDTVVKTDLVMVRDTMPETGLPFAAGFDTAGVTDFSHWQLSNTRNDTGWQLTNIASFSGGQSVFVDSSASTSGSISELVSPVIELDPTKFAQPLEISFAVAYAPTSAVDRTRLRLSFSTNCGQGWRLRQAYNATSGNPTLGSAPELANGVFVPTAADWQVITTNVPFLNGRFFQLKISAELFGGNALYLDQININGIPVSVRPLTRKPTIQIYPNPATDATVLRVPVSESAVTVRLLTADGRVGQQRQVTAGQTRQEVSLSSLFGKPASGLYIVEVAGLDYIVRQKLLIP